MWEMRLCNCFLKQFQRVQGSLVYAFWKAQKAFPFLYFLSTYPEATFSRETSWFVFHNKGVHWPVTLMGAYHRDMNAHVELTVLGGIYMKEHAFCFRKS